MSRHDRRCAGAGALIPVLVTFADPGDPATARRCRRTTAEAALGKGFRLRGVTAEVVPNGFWPLDFGGALGEPVTRGSRRNCPGWTGTDDPAATALEGGGPAGAASAIDAKEVFTRK